MGTTTTLRELAVDERGLRVRVVERLFSGSLDRKLAAGADPVSSPVLALHAARLCSPRRRREIARGLRDAIETADRGQRSFSAAIPVRSHAVRKTRDDIEGLARQLTAPLEVDPRGVALAHLLLTDGDGPLYNPGEEHQLAAAVRDAHRALRGGP